MLQDRSLTEEEDRIPEHVVEEADQQDLAAPEGILPDFSFISYSNVRKRGQFLHFSVENHRKRGKNRTESLPMTGETATD